MKHTPEFLKLVEEAMLRVQEIGTAEVQANAASFRLIDVREDSEWNNGHIPGAIHIGRGVIERDIETMVPAKSTKMVLYCGGGYRSVLAADNLQKMGYTQVFSMRGGWREWCDQNFPVKK